MSSKHPSCTLTSAADVNVVNDVDVEGLFKEVKWDVPNKYVRCIESDVVNLGITTTFAPRYNVANSTIVVRAKSSKNRRVVGVLRSYADFLK